MGRAMKGALLSCILLWGGARGAVARDCLGVGFPDRVQVDGAGLVLNGLGVRRATILAVKVYVAGLYVRRVSGDAAVLMAEAGPSRLVLHFVRDVGAGRMREAWSEGFARSAGAAAMGDRIATLNSWMTDMKDGQEIAFDFLAGGGVRVTVAGAVRGTVPGADFSRALLGIWLGPAPPNPALKAGLLGGACD